MKSNNMIEEYLSELRRDDRFDARDEMIYLGESIDKYEYAVVLIGDWEIDDEVASNVFSGIGRNRKKSKLIMLEMSWSLISGTKIVYRDIFLDICMDIREIVIAQ